MTEFKLWNEYDGGLAPSSSVNVYRNELELHSLIWRNIDILPLSGSPKLTRLKWEAPIGKGSADILAVESTGRPVIIEVKLRRNIESISSIASQVLYYATFLRGRTIKGMNSWAANSGGYTTVFDKVKANDPSGVPDRKTFDSNLQNHLSRGDFRLVLALDGVRPRLERLVAYLDEFTTSDLAIDLVIIPKYDVNGTLVYQAQRIVPSMDAARNVALGGVPSQAGWTRSSGPEEFIKAVREIGGESLCERYEDVISWAMGLTCEIDIVRLYSRVHSGSFSPQLEIKGGWKKLGPVLIIGEIQGPAVRMYRHRLQNSAPGSISEIENAISPVKLGIGNHVRRITDDVKHALKMAYMEAYGKS